MAQVRDGRGPRVTELATRRVGDEDRTRHRHGSGGGRAGFTHEHVLGRGQHRHVGPRYLAGAAETGYRERPGGPPTATRLGGVLAPLAAPIERGQRDSDVVSDEKAVGMSDKTGIEWCDATWNLVTGCTKVSPGCALARVEPPQPVSPDVVAADIAPRPPTVIVAAEGLAAATGAEDNWVRLSRLLSPALFHAVRGLVVKAGGHDLKILSAIVGLVAIPMMHDLPSPKPAPKVLFGDQAVLVDVASPISRRMARKADQHVAIRGNCPTAFPLLVAWPAASSIATTATCLRGALLRTAALRTWFFHAFSIAHRLLPRREVMPHAYGD